MDPEDGSLFELQNAEVNAETVQAMLPIKIYWRCCEYAGPISQFLVPA
jgi:hypothetical protein